MRNPVEIGLGKRGLSQYYRDGLKIVASDPQIDMVMTFLNPEDYVHYGIGEWEDQVSKELIVAAKTLPKPLVVTFMPGRDVKVFSSIVEIQDRCQEAGVACFSSLDAAIKATAKLATYYEFRHNR